MVSLEVGIDARGVVQGGAQASSALAGVAQLASVMSAQLAGSSTAMTAFGASVTAAMPWITAIGAALSGVSTALLLMSSRTQQAASDWDRLGDSMRKADAGAKASGLLGLQQAGYFDTQAQQQISGLQQAMLTNKPATLGGLASATGITQMQLARVLMDLGNTQAGQLLTTGEYGTGRFLQGGQMSMPSEITSRTAGDISVPQDQITQLFQRSFGSYRARADRQRLLEEGAPQYNGPMREGYDPFSLQDSLPGYRDPYGYGPGSRGVDMDPVQQAKIDYQISQRDAAAALKKSNEESREMLATWMQISDTVADTATNLQFGFTSAREAMAGLLYDVARGLNREVMGSLTKSIVSSFSSTAAQSR